MSESNLERYKALTTSHKANCELYSNYVDSMFPNEINKLSDIPFLPVKVFKEFELKSVSEENVYKTMYSSGTSGKQSKIILDKETAKLQSVELAKSFKQNFGGNRFPMLIIDNELTAKGKTARTAAVNGFSLFGKKRCFALTEDMELKFEEVQSFLAAHQEQKVFIFGFTFVIYQYFIKYLSDNKLSLDLSNCFILHGGGWKKLVSLNISNDEFKHQIQETTGCISVHNYYGMIEQTGSLYFECPNGQLHAPHNGSLLIRNLNDLSANNYGEKGLIQVFSEIQHSYPGHSLLTEDIGVAYPPSDCPCGQQGDILKFIGRLQKADVRGCSDAV